MAKNTSFKDKKADELAKLLVEKREELRALRFASAGARGGKGGNDARQIRKDVARIMTEQTAQKNAAA